MNRASYLVLKNKYEELKELIWLLCSEQKVLQDPMISDFKSEELFKYFMKDSDLFIQMILLKTLCWESSKYFCLKSRIYPIIHIPEYDDILKYCNLKIRWSNIFTQYTKRSEFSEFVESCDSLCLKNGVYQRFRVMLSLCKRYFNESFFQDVVSRIGNMQIKFVNLICSEKFYTYNAGFCFLRVHVYCRQI